LKVLEVVQEEKLQAHALTVGERLLAGLRALQQRHEIISDVRGSGLFIGVELVREGRPADVEAARVVNQMREHGILLGTDGPHHNVLKIRPPMPFSEENAEELIATLRETLGPG
jgi:4-aminobutyrate aminotransferase-like enzyme